MIAADIWARLWAVCQAYPAVAILLLVLLCIFGTLVATAITGLSRHELPLHRWEDDDEQAKAVTRPAPLQVPPTWGRSGGNWWGKL